jgi:antirestriction protein ArdC
LPNISGGEPLDFDPITKCEEVLNAWGNRLKIDHIHGNKAGYNRLADTIIIPEPQYFDSREEYYATLFHEMIHATGSPDRLDREKGQEFGDQTYSFEELVAEIGAAYLCGHCGIEKPVLENKTAYINSWISRLEKEQNKDWVVMACGKAEKAAKYIIESKVTEQESFKKAS